MSLLPMPFDNPSTYPGHSGVDFPQPKGTPIRASGPGRVLRLPETDAGGYWSTILYDNGATVGYAHQDNPVTVVDVGDRVREGTVIGYVGRLGRRSTGYHLHMERIGHGTYDSMMAILDTSRVVGAPAPASTPATPEPADLIGDITMAQIRYVHRVEPGYDVEWMIVGLELPGGFEITTDETTAVGWGAVYGTPEGDSWKALNRKQYIALQSSAAELHRRWVKMQQTIAAGIPA